MANQQNPKQNQDQQKKTGVGQQPSQPQKQQGSTTGQPINNPNVRK